MPKTKYVVKVNETTELYLIYYDTTFGTCEWGGIDNESLLQWDTLEEAEQMASLIGHGSVGSPRPHL